MIKGIGIDIIEIERIEHAINKNGDTFISRIFTKQEIAYCQKKNDACPFFAGHFAAKEAILKALGTGLRQISWQDIEINHDALGKPYAVFSTTIQQNLKNSAITTVHISISHSRNYAVAQAVIEG